MIRTPVIILLAALLTAAPLAPATAQDRPRPAGSDEQPRVSMAEAVRAASAGRQGRFLGASDRGGTIVVRWEYPGGRVADIMVDGRTGRVIGER